MATRSRPALLAETPFSVSRRPRLSPVPLPICRLAASARSSPSFLKSLASPTKVMRITTASLSVVLGRRPVLPTAKLRTTSSFITSVLRIGAASSSFFLAKSPCSIASALVPMAAIATCLVQSLPFPSSEILGSASGSPSFAC